MMWGYGWDMSWAWLIAILVLALVALLACVAVRLFSPGSSRDRDSALGGSTPAKTPAQLILEERFARGELTADQYREQLRVLGER